MESFSLQIEFITALMGWEHYRNETVSDNLLFEHCANRTQHQYRARMGLLSTSLGLGSMIYACALFEKECKGSIWYLRDT